MKVATIGFFDGVHRGHQFLIQQVMDEARRRGATSLVVTFSNHPRSVVGTSAAVPLLSTSDEKREMLRQQGVDEVQMLEFTTSLAALTARQFMQKLHDEQGVDVLVIGYDHRFGHNRAEGFDDYCRYGREMGIEVVQAQALTDDYIPVSSSLIRAALLEGRVDNASQLLGHHYMLTGRVVDGFKIGRRLGYPTANICAPSDKLLPCDGVYVVEAIVGNTRSYGMLNIGFRPTFNSTARTIEVHLFDFNADIYSQHITLHFLHHLREERKFETPEQLVEQLTIDEQQAREYLTGN